MTVPEPSTAAELTAQSLIQTLGLEPHPEGGFYTVTYASDTYIPTARGPRRASTAILFLLTRSTFSALHRIQSDEAWHFYSGAPIRIVVISPETRKLEQVILGTDLRKGQTPQTVVKAGAWFGAEMVEGLGKHEWSLVGCTVAPGFDFQDFELGKREELVDEYPQHNEVVNRLTRAKL